MGNSANHQYCANCIYCKVIKVRNEDDRTYVLRVRCEKGMWQKKLGGEKLYKYFTIVRRVSDTCECYSPMGNATDYIRDLRQQLPINDEQYSIV